MAIAVATAVAYSIWPDFSTFCPASDKGETALCIREWLSAASGYFATAAAAATIFFLYRQNAEQKRQTEFMLGDALPTMDVTQDLADPEYIVVTLVNWNRRGVILFGVDIEPLPEGNLSLLDITVDGRSWRNRLEFAPYLKGWLDRQSQPHVAKYKITGTNEFPFYVWSEDTEVLAHIQIIDETHRRVTLRASLFPKGGGPTGLLRM